MKIGQVFTPKNIASLMLDRIDLSKDSLLKNKFLEPSFGEGVFIQLILDRVMDLYKNRTINIEDIRLILDNIYGVEIDKKLYKDTKNKLNERLKIIDKGLSFKHLYNEDFLDFKTKLNFDYIVGNPPFIRIQDLDSKYIEKVKDFKFTSGNTDLYIFFFERSIDLLSKDGRLVFLTPISYFLNNSQKSFRKHLKTNNLIEEIIDLSSVQVFKGFYTYTCITVIQKNRPSKSTKYSRLLNTNTEDKDGYKEVILSQVKNIDINIFEDRWHFDITKEVEDRLFGKGKKFSDFINCRYGVATNKDSVFINDSVAITKFLEGGSKDKKPPILSLKEINNTNTFKDKKKLIRPSFKVSKYKGNVSLGLIIYPYIDGELISEERLMKNKPLYNYLKENKPILTTRTMDKNLPWYAYGKSQGIKYMDNQKIVINHIVANDSKEINACILDKSVVVYSGLFITSSYNLSIIKQILESKDFLEYVKVVGRELSGGYKSIIGKDILNYRLTSEEVELLINNKNK